MLEILLQMHKRARSLDEPFEKVVVGGVGVEPNLLEHIVGFIIELLVPATEIGAVIRMVRNFVPKIDIVALELADELRNPLAFVHVGLNLTGLRWAANLDHSFRRRAPEAFGAAATNDGV